jgi:hypothetical protein
MTTLNTTQREILKLFTIPLTDSELDSLKSLLIDFLSKKTIFEADQAFQERGYTQQTIKEWKKEHMRVRNIEK